MLKIDKIMWIGNFSNVEKIVYKMKCYPFVLKHGVLDHESYSTMILFSPERHHEKSC